MAIAQNGFDRNGSSYSGTSLEDRIDPLLESTSRWNGNVAAAAGRSSMDEVREVVTREMGERGVRFVRCGVEVGPSRMVGAAGLARCGASARPCRPGSIRSSASMRPSRQTRGLAGRCLCWSTARWVPRNAADALGTRPVSFGAIYKARCVDAGPIRRIDHPAEPPRASSRRCGKRHFSPVFNDVTDMAGVMASGSMRGAGRWR